MLDQRNEIPEDHVTEARSLSLVIFSYHARRQNTPSPFDRQNAITAGAVLPVSSLADRRPAACFKIKTGMPNALPGTEAMFRGLRSRRLRHVRPLNVFILA